MMTTCKPTRFMKKRFGSYITMLPLIILAAAVVSGVHMSGGSHSAVDAAVVKNDKHRSLTHSLRGGKPILHDQQRLQSQSQSQLSTTPMSMSMSMSTTSQESSDAPSKARRKLLSTKRYVARYSGPDGRVSVQRCAKSIVNDEDDTDYTVFEVDVEIEVDVEVNAAETVLLDPNGYYYDYNSDVGTRSENNNDDVEGCLSSLRNTEGILDVEEDRPVSLLQDPEVLPSSSIESFAKGLDESLWNVEAIQAHQVSPGPNKVTICVVDTGIAIDHPGFSPEASKRAEGDNKDTAQIKGRNFESLQFGVGSSGTRLMQWNRDTNGHGTHVAGVILEVISRIDSSSLPSNIDLFVVSAFDGNDCGYESDVVRAVRTCVGEAKADVINLSLGNSYPSTFTAQLYQTIVEKGGAVMVAAAGNKDQNDSEDYAFYPASIPSVISVGAVQRGGASYPRSIRNNQVEFVGPGHEILSTGVRWNKEKEKMEYVYERRSGTSTAAPHIAGAVALVKSHHPTCSNRQIRYALAETAIRSESINEKEDSLGLLNSDVEWGADYDSSSSDCDSTQGYGTIQVRDALDWLLYQGGCAFWDVKSTSHGGCSTLSEGIVRLESQNSEGSEAEDRDNDTGTTTALSDDNERSQDGTESVPTETENGELESSNASTEEDADITSSTILPVQETVGAEEGVENPPSQDDVSSFDEGTEEDANISSSTITPVQETLDSEDSDISSSTITPVQEILDSEDSDISSSTITPVRALEMTPVESDDVTGDSQDESAFARANEAAPSLRGGFILTSNP